jgi:hypothetical protein
MFKKKEKKKKKKKKKKMEVQYRKSYGVTYKRIGG